MDEQKKPRAREKRVVSGGKGVEKQGEALDIGPLNNAGNYADRKAQQPGAQRPSQPQGNPFAAPHSSASRPASGGQAQRPSQPQGNPFAAPHSSRPAGGQSGTQRPAAGGQTQRSSGSARAGGSLGGMFGGSSGASGGSSGGQRPGGGSKMILLIIVAVLLLGGGKLTGLFGGNDSPLSDLTGGYSGQTSSGAPSSSGTSSGSSSGTSSGSSSGSLFGTSSGTSSGSSSSGGLADLLSAFLSSSGSSVYDFGTTGSSAPSESTDITSLLSSGGSSSEAQPDTTVATGAREKFTVLKGKQKDTVTLMVYMCGSDLESQNGMGTSDLKEMAAASLGKNVNLIVYTGGASRWRNNVVSSSVHQIYQIRDGGLYCLEENMGSGSMTSPGTLTKFIQYGAKNFPANRMCLIFWDHGGGSVSGFGHDERNTSSGSMSLAGINTALKNGGIKFDFIGFDACLMATVENGLMLSQYADYMIASEETEPGVGWYYTNWLNKLGANPSMPTLEVGRLIADDFVAVCNRQCRGQGTTLSITDLAELSATVPPELKAFGAGTSSLIQNNEFNRVSTARSRTREFAQSSRIDQVDLIHFARNLGTSDGEKLAKALEGAVKYNRTGGGMSNANGLSIYFPYKRAGKVNQMVSTYSAIGMDEEYARCIQEFASLEVSGQVAGGTPVSSYDLPGFGSGFGSSGSSMPGLMDVLLGGGSASSGYSSGYASGNDLTDLLGGLFGSSSGSSSGSAGGIYSLFSGRSLTADSAAAYISSHHLDTSALVWDGNRIHLSRDHWAQITDVELNVFVDDGNGFIDLGLDNSFSTEGDDLVSSFDGTWLSIDKQPVAYYYLGIVENGPDEYVMSGYVPALLNGVRVNLLLNFDHERPYGYIAGAEPVYASGESDTQAKNLIQVGSGDTLQFLCEYYDYKGNYQASYRLGSPLTLGDTVEIANTEIGKPAVATYLLTDLYQQRWWTPSVP